MYIDLITVESGKTTYSDIGPQTRHLVLRVQRTFGLVVFPMPHDQYLFMLGRVSETGLCNTPRGVLCACSAVQREREVQ